MRRLLMALMVLAMAIPCAATQYWFVAGTDPDGTAHDGDDGRTGKASIAYDQTLIKTIDHSTQGWILQRISGTIGDDWPVGEVVYLTRDGATLQAKVTVRLGTNAVKFTQLSGSTLAAASDWVSAASDGPKATIASLLAGSFDLDQDQVVSINGTVSETSALTFDENNDGTNWTFQTTELTGGVAATVSTSSSIALSTFLTGTITWDDVDLHATGTVALLTWNGRYSTATLHFRDCTITRDYNGALKYILASSTSYAGEDWFNRKLYCTNVEFVTGDRLMSILTFSSGQFVFTNCTWTQPDGGDISEGRAFQFPTCVGHYDITITGGTYVFRSTGADKYLFGTPASGGSQYLRYRVQDVTATVGSGFTWHEQTGSCNTAITIENNTITHTGPAANVYVIRIGAPSNEYSSCGFATPTLIRNNRIICSAGSDTYSVHGIHLGPESLGARIENNVFQGQCIAPTTPNLGDADDPPKAIHLRSARGTRITENKIAWGVGIYLSCGYHETPASALEQQDSGTLIQWNNIYQSLTTTLGCIAIRDNTSTDDEVYHYDPKNLRIMNNMLVAATSSCLYVRSHVSDPAVRPMVKDNWTVNQNNYYVSGDAVVADIDAADEATLGDLVDWWGDREATTDGNTSLTDSGSLAAMRANDGRSKNGHYLWDDVGRAGAERRAGGSLFITPD